MTETYDQPTRNPTRKVIAGASGGISGASVATLVLAFVKVKWPDVYLSLTEVPEITLAMGGAISVVIGYISSYFTRERL